MVRGYQRRMVVIKNTDSDMFDEAYFILNDNDRDKEPCEEDMIREANRIIEENLSLDSVERQRSGLGGVMLSVADFFRRNTLPFLSGGAVGALIILVLVHF